MVHLMRQESHLIMNPHKIPVLIIIFSTLHSSCPSQFPTSLMIKEWVDQMQQELVNLADTASAGKSLVQIFMNNQNYYTVKANKAGKLVENAARNIENFLNKRAKALEFLPDFAEEVKRLLDISPEPQLWSGCVRVYLRACGSSVEDVCVDGVGEEVLTEKDAQC